MGEEREGWGGKASSSSCWFRHSNRCLSGGTRPLGSTRRPRSGSLLRSWEERCRAVVSYLSTSRPDEKVRRLLSSVTDQFIVCRAIVSPPPKHPFSAPLLPVPVATG